MAFDISHPEIQDAVRRALAEDIGSGDITTNLCVPAEAMATGRMVARESLTLAGVELLPLIFTDCIVALTRHSGDRVEERRRDRGRAGSGASIADGRTDRVELRPAVKRSRDAGRGVRSRRGRDALPDSGYSQDHAGAATAGEDGGGGGRRGESSHGPVRRGADQEQPHHGRGRRPGSAGAHARTQACRSRSKSGRAKNWTRRWPAGPRICCWTIFRRRRRRSGSRTSTGARRWSCRAASRSKPLGPTRNPARISCRAARLRTRHGRWTSILSGSTLDLRRLPQQLVRQGAPRHKSSAEPP